MFPARYYPARYFPARYWPEVGAAGVTPALRVLLDRQYTAPAAADGAVLTPTGVVWTNSAYVDLLAAMPAAGVLTGVTVRTENGAASTVSYDAEVDVATGAAGSETVIATVRVFNALSTASGQTGPTHHLVFPVPIDALPNGARVSARLRKNNTSVTVWSVAMTYLQKPLTTTVLTTAQPPKTLPPAAAGVTLTASATPWTSGSWGQLRTASGAALVVTGVVCGAPSSAVTPATAGFEVDLGTGGAGSETVITTLRIETTNQGQPGLLMLPTPLDNIPASTRVAARLRSSTASATMVVSLMVLELPL